ncbi:class I SAM-dependent methyltransferase [Nicoliella spurrieriana]|uniref:Class I SAM-dependent methyltransferase n=1 Tax=Nicoliella spurrieriana TaxID=2925830 RepID=A0A976RT44_9LACO|nr:class I SAM-dependent methyltransferase [Nicoliella spurrieriana]UQS87342.1 class I SAM-dependent methyltransferase [Nicoliella spurrieriana]
MIKKLLMYGVDDPYWFYVGIISAIVIAAADFKRLWWLSVIFLLITLLTVLKTIRKFQIINSLLTDQALLPVERGLDLSVGTGYSTVRLARAALYGQITGIEDAYQSSGDHARNNVYKRMVGNRVNVMAGDITHLPFPDDSFDVITGNYSKMTELSINNRKKRKAICDEVERLIKKDGTGSILMVNTKRQIRKMAIEFSKKEGFQVYLADPELRVKFGYGALKIEVK